MASSEGRNFIRYGKELNHTLRAGTMTPLEAKTFDQKYDDGVANTGKITGHSGMSSPPCIVGGNGDYWLAIKQDNACVFHYWINK